MEEMKLNVTSRQLRIRGERHATCGHALGAPGVRRSHEFQERAVSLPDCSQEVSQSEKSEELPEWRSRGSWGCAVGAARAED